MFFWNDWFFKLICWIVSLKVDKMSILFLPQVCKATANNQDYESIELITKSQIALISTESSPPTPAFDGPASEPLIIMTSQHPPCRSAASQQASSACCRSSRCSASPPSWRNTPCQIDMAGNGGYNPTRIQAKDLKCSTFNLSCLDFFHFFFSVCKVLYPQSSHLLFHDKHEYVPMLFTACLGDFYCAPQSNSCWPACTWKDKLL